MPRTRPRRPGLRAKGKLPGLRGGTGLGAEPGDVLTWFNYWGAMGLGRRARVVVQSFPHTQRTRGLSRGETAADRKPRAQGATLTGMDQDAKNKFSEKSTTSPVL